MKTTLFVAGFGARTRARELAYEFERYGRLIRCDIPAAKSYTAKPFAFVEYEDPHDAEDAFNEMHGRSVDGYTISVQWARNAPSAKWRLGGPTTTPNPPPLPPHGSSSRRRSMSPAHTHSALSRGRSPPPSSYYTEPPSTIKRYSYNNERSRSRPRSPPFSSSRYEQGQQKYTFAYAYQKSTNSPPPEAKKNSPTTQTSLQQQSTRQSYLHSPPPFL